MGMRLFSLKNLIFLFGGGIGEALAEFTRREDVERYIFQDNAPADMGDKESFPDQARDYFGAEYAYLFEDGRWLVCEIHISSHSEWRELTEVLKEPELSEP